MVGFTLLSRSYYYLCVDEVPPPRSPPAHRQAQGNGGLLTVNLLLIEMLTGATP